MERELDWWALLQVIEECDFSRNNLGNLNPNLLNITSVKAVVFQLGILTLLVLILPPTPKCCSL